MHGGQHGMGVKTARYVDEDREPASNERVCQPTQGHDPTVNTSRPKGIGHVKKGAACREVGRQR